MADYDLVPVEHTPEFIEPFGGEFQSQPVTPEQTEAFRGAVGRAFRNTVGAPGVVAQPIAPATPDVWSDEDEARRLATEGTAFNWGPQQALSMVGQGTPFAVEGAFGSAGGKGIRAYHGSPHDFDKFDLSKIGTGAGAQAYGHGLYFAEHPDVAQQYKENLAVTPKVNSFNWNPDGTPNRVGQVASELDAKISEADIRAGLKVKEPHASDEQISSWIDGGRKLYADAQKAGKMYEVNINANPEHFLDWDKPLSEQHPIVQKAFNYRNHNITDEEIAARRAKGDNATADFLESQRTHYDARAGMKPTEEFNLNDPSVIGKLRQAGIPGIKYLDRGSRGKEGGTSNYVVFDDKLIDIIKKYGIAGLVAGGAAHFGLRPVDHDPFAEQLEDGKVQQFTSGAGGLSREDVRTLHDVGQLGRHADWSKFERNARPSTNIEDARTDPLLRYDLRGLI